MAGTVVNTMGVKDNDQRRAGEVTTPHRTSVRQTQVVPARVGFRRSGPISSFLDSPFRYPTIVLPGEVVCPSLCTRSSLGVSRKTTNLYPDCSATSRTTVYHAATAPAKGMPSPLFGHVNSWASPILDDSRTPSSACSGAVSAVRRRAAL